jgi:ubiquinone/menaquinone biosynthesis C-methylase UbiE
MSVNEAAVVQTFPSASEAQDRASLFQGIRRRWRRERRRRKVGRAYDMALEIARFVEKHSTVLDVGCGNGYIAHHLSALLQTKVVGIDVADTTEAAIDYRVYDGKHFPIADNSVDAVLCCYVLHHVQDVATVLTEARRVLRPGGKLLIYEDIPELWWDRLVCAVHNRQWKNRTGPCTFRSAGEWQYLLSALGFCLRMNRPLARARNLTHPVTRQVFLMIRC